MLDLHSIYKTFNAGTVNEKTALNGLNLHLNEGDFVTIIGGNGAGKSTLLGVLSGRIACDQGIVKRNCAIAEILQTGETEDEPEARLLSRLKLRDSSPISSAP